MAAHCEHLFVLAFVGSMIRVATASTRGEDDDLDLSSESTSDTEPDERYHAPDLYKPPSSLVERAVHRVEQNLEAVMKADLKKIEQRVMDKVNKVQAKQMRRLREMQETETIREKADALPQGASQIENDLVPSDEELPADDSEEANAKKDADAAESDPPPSASLAATQSDADDHSNSEAEDTSSADQEVAKEAKDSEKEKQESDSAADSDRDEVSALLEKVGSEGFPQTKAKSSNRHSEAFKHRKKSIEVDAEGDGMMRRE